jgi:hypothetical protein
MFVRGVGSAVLSPCAHGIRLAAAGIHAKRSPKRKTEFSQTAQAGLLRGLWCIIRFGQPVGADSGPKPPNPQAAMRLIRPNLAAGACAAALTVITQTPAAAAEDVAQYVQFVQEPAALCVERNGVQIQVKSSHPSRTLRVWLDRIHMGVGTGDRSRSELAPGGDAQPLGCSRSLSGPQEWRVVKAEFVD